MANTTNAIIKLSSNIENYMSITATRALYIKLGRENCWASRAFKDGVLLFGFRAIAHQDALAAVKKNDFRFVKDYYEKNEETNPATATRYSNEVREFYTAASDVLWITFSDGRMWWCFASAEVTPIASDDLEVTGSKCRKTLNGWSDKDLNGQTLWINALRGDLTTTAGFRGTICRVKEFDYLVRRLNGEETEATKAVRNARLALIEALIPLIRGLHWRDFELLVELTMTQGGWRRVSATGETQKTIDLELELPLTGERALVQVKSTITHDTADNVICSLTEAAGSARSFLVYHTGPEKLSNDQDNVTIIGPETLAKHVVDVGLTAWVMGKVG